MSPTIERLEEDLLQLPETDRIRLATTLLSSLPIPEGVLELGTPEFETEIRRRSAEMMDGTVVGIPYEVAMKDIDALLSGE